MNEEQIEKTNEFPSDFESWFECWDRLNYNPIPPVKKQNKWDSHRSD